MTTPTEARTAALQELADNRDLLEALEERVRGGDESVAAAELAARRDLLRLAELRVEAAERTLTAWDAQQRAEQYVRLGQEARAVAAVGTGELVRLADDLRPRLAALFHAAMERQRRQVRLREHGRELYAVASAAGELPALFAAGAREPVPGTGFGRQVDATMPDGTVVPIPHVFAFEVAVAVVATELDRLTRHPEHGASSLHVELSIFAQSVTRRLPELAPADWRPIR